MARRGERRMMAKELIQNKEASQKRVCRLLEISESALYYRSIKRSHDACIKGVLKRLAKAHPKWGFEMMFTLIRRDEKCRWNHKRVYRIYCELGLNLRRRKKKRLPVREKQHLIQPLLKNECWSIDFMSDALISGKKFRTFNVIDDFNREALRIKASQSMPAERVTNYLDETASSRGYPKKIRVDNGPEFISKAFQLWAQKHDVKIKYIQPGKPSQNGYIERFNRTFREEVLDMYLFRTINEAQERANDWLKIYNEDRPHKALGGKAPCEFNEVYTNEKNVSSSLFSSSKLDNKGTDKGINSILEHY